MNEHSSGEETASQTEEGNNTEAAQFEAGGSSTNSKEEEDGNLGGQVARPIGDRRARYARVAENLTPSIYGSEYKWRLLAYLLVFFNSCFVFILGIDVSL